MLIRVYDEIILKNKSLADLQVEFRGKKMYGHEFKELRLEQGITQKEACKGICSESKLSRWENDQIEVEFSTAMKLLNRIHITSHEFMGWSKFSPQPETDKEVTEAWNKEEIPLIKHVAKKQLDKYHQSKNPFDLLSTVALFNQLVILDNHNYLPEIDQIKLANIFSKVVIWSEYYLALFGSSIFLLTPKQVYGISKLILKDVSRITEANTTYDLEVMLGVMGDATIKLILSNDIKHATSLIKEIKKIELPHYMMFFTLTFNYLDKIANYVTTKNEQPILNLINTMVQISCPIQAEIYLDVFKQVKNNLDRKTRS